VHTAIIVNRHAGSIRRDPKLADQMRAACGRHASLHVTQDLEELYAVAGAAAGRGVTTIGLVGGDGTASATLTAIDRAYGDQPRPAIALLRGGTMNTIASSLGVSHRSPLALLRRTLKVAHAPNGLIHRRPVMRIGERLGFLFGTGVWYGYLAESYANGQPTRLTNATVLGRALASAAINGSTYTRIFDARELDVRFDGGAWETRSYLTVAAGTVADAGFGFRPFHRALDSDQRFQLFAIRGRATDVLVDLPGIWFGRGLSPDTAYNTTTSWAELRSTNGPFGYAVDGDLSTAQNTLRLELGPVFRFLRI
jgi:diacylglycerol kinase (ATP)